MFSTVLQLNRNNNMKGTEEELDQGGSVSHRSAETHTHTQAALINLHQSIPETLDPLLIQRPGKADLGPAESPARSLQPWSSSL